MRYKVIIAYDGYEYHGWQTQHLHNSIQEVMETALKVIHGKHIEIIASGRTDSKVHALGQVAHFDSELAIKPAGMVKALNSNLPDNIRIKKAEIVSDDFHARFDCVSKRYDYYLTNDNDNPFLKRYMGSVRGDLAVDKMQQAAQIFIGTHDFTSFTSSKVNALKDKTRTITKFEVKAIDSGWHFIMEGDGFLRYQCRNMVATLIEVGKEKLTISDVEAMLQAADKHACRYKAEPQGLYLVEVNYEEVK